MLFQPPEGMEEYLKPTELCDADNDQVTTKAEKLTRDASSAKESALSIFNFVRDQIPFGLDSLDTKASRTLRKGYGFCVTKTNLQVALLRSIGVPARYHQVVLHKDVLKGIVP
ncbi:MAG: transglutaminase, partial [candidate division Zixibacteria bacterium]|nr:transglutaminase [candidate division Zixibacteria bacterium]